MLLRFVFLLSISFSTSSYGASLALKNYTGVECGETPVIEESAACGVELYQNMESPQCPARYERAQDARCGVSAYISASTQRCGVARYKERKDKSCPGYVASDYLIRHQQDSCPAGYRVLSKTECNPESNNKCSQQSWGVTCQRDEYVAACRSPQFGVEAWNTCAHPDHGVAAWKSCSVQTGYEACRSTHHPIEKYKTCVTRKTPSSCQVYLPPSELPGWMNSNKFALKFRLENLMQWAVNFQNVEKDIRGLGCLIKRISTESGFAGNIVFEEEVLKDMLDSYSTTSGKEFDLKDFESDTCSSPLASVKSVVCFPEDFSSRCVAVRGYQFARNDLVSFQEDLALLKNDTIAATRQPFMTEIESMAKTISDTLSREKESTP